MYYPSAYNDDNFRIRLLTLFEILQLDNKDNLQLMTGDLNSKGHFLGLRSTINLSLNFVLSF